MIGKLNLLRQRGAEAVEDLINKRNIGAIDRRIPRDLGNGGGGRLGDANFDWGATGPEAGKLQGPARKSVHWLKIGTEKYTDANGDEQERDVFAYQLFDFPSGVEPKNLPDLYDVEITIDGEKHKGKLKPTQYADNYHFVMRKNNEDAASGGGAGGGGGSTPGGGGGGGGGTGGGTTPQPPSPPFLGPPINLGPPITLGSQTTLSSSSFSTVETSPQPGGFTTATASGGDPAPLPPVLTDPPISTGGGNAGNNGGGNNGGGDGSTVDEFDLFVGYLPAGKGSYAASKEEDEEDEEDEEGGDDDGSGGGGREDCHPDDSGRAHPEGSGRGHPKGYPCW